MKTRPAYDITLRAYWKEALGGFDAEIIRKKVVVLKKLLLFSLVL